jgi:hypothetical protein
VDVPVPTGAGRRRRGTAASRPTTAPDHLLDPARGVGPAAEDFFGGLVERHEKKP